MHPLNTAESPVTVDELLAKAELPKVVALGKPGWIIFISRILLRSSSKALLIIWMRQR
ncbi:hypothetical protein [Aliamphritea spongicola]|nr:hypothetical protein [Aliamphritea spongicola]